MTRKPGLLIPVPLLSSTVDQLADSFDIVIPSPTKRDDPTIERAANRIQAIAAGAAILTGGVHVLIDAALMRQLPNLKLVANLGAGYDQIDTNWAHDHGIIVTNTPDVLTEETADTALGLLLNVIRQLPRAERHLRSGGWRESAFELTDSLRGRTLGIFGLGRIGEAIAKRAVAFGVSVLYHNRNPVAGVRYGYCSTLLELAERCDILMIAAPGGPSTRHAVNKDVLNALGPNGVVINVARGSIVDEAALVAALRNRRILSAGLDVFADEPNVPDELVGMDHVVLLPHVGSASTATRNAMNDLLIANLLAWANGNPVLTPV